MEHRYTILLIDADKHFHSEFRTLAGSEYETRVAAHEREAFDHLEKHKIDVVVLELLHGDSPAGVNMFFRMRENFPNMPIIILTKHSDISTAVELMKNGAFHYLLKPPSAADLRTWIQKAIENHTLNRARHVAKEQTEPTFSRIIGRSASMQDVLDAIDRVAATDISVLITGESGTGKELVAHEIHIRSQRRKGPFIPVNCSSLVRDLIESELFGHVKGSFTGASQTKQGKFELADGGSIFLDEVAELDGLSQGKLLRVLQEREIDRVGGSFPIPVNVRVIAATNKNLSLLNQQGLFREDLYYRLNVYPIHLPSLREHPEDIPMLVDSFVYRFGKSMGKRNLRINSSTLDYLQQYRWPGNVRELENVIQRSILLATGATLEPDHLPKEIVEKKQTSTTGASLRRIEREARDQAAKVAIIRALEQTEWSIEASARILQLPSKTLYDRCAKLQIKLPKRKIGQKVRT